MLSKQESKYLGVTLSTRFGTRSSPWKAHIINITSNAQKKLGFLRRSLRGCPHSLRESGYSSLVRSTLEYAGVVWDTTVGGEIEQLEMVQHRAARWAKGKRPREQLSVTSLLRELGWATLQDRRRVNRLAIFYKILKKEFEGHIDINSTDLDLEIHRPNSYRKHCYNLQRLSGKDKNSPLWHGTIIRTITNWNDLPEDSSLYSGCEATVFPFTTFKEKLSYPTP